ncbi:hypothetical protein E2562_011584 [Oryza meyeriana var. granulata]|uniref:Uncharacterized protein n=1 Tax=Oryza meyeriana var. granulata TaxID=110450 RepID=A0A6G1DYI7_9ORYZ|nr:hypothetical protein E2562_011584 [Oryza meyeriana var. granulata]
MAWLARKLFWTGGRKSKGFFSAKYNVETLELYLKKEKTSNLGQCASRLPRDKRDVEVAVVIGEDMVVIDE